ncbi:hypothetical protein EIP91_009176, partial [Steccherinum ochraceum]
MSKRKAVQLGKDPDDLVNAIREANRRRTSEVPAPPSAAGSSSLSHSKGRLNEDLLLTAIHSRQKETVKNSSTEAGSSTSRATHDSHAAATNNSDAMELDVIAATVLDRDIKLAPLDDAAMDAHNSNVMKEIIRLSQIAPHTSGSHAAAAAVAAMSFNKASYRSIGTAQSLQKRLEGLLERVELLSDSSGSAVIQEALSKAESGSKDVSQKLESIGRDDTADSVKSVRTVLRRLQKSIFDLRLRHPDTGPVKMNSGQP